MDKYIAIFLLCSGSIFAAPKEIVLESDIYVGDTVHYQIELFDTNDSELSIEEGEIYEDDTMPSYKIFNVNKKPSKLEASIIFYKPGTYILPVSWDQNGTNFRSSLSIKVKSQLLGSETDIEDIEPPIVFSGPYFFRLFIVLLITAINLYLVYALYLYWRKKPKVMDAFWEKQPTLDETTKRLHIVEKYLESDSIHEKELMFKISEYLKEVYSKRLDENLLGKTDSEFFVDLSNRTHIENSALRELRIHFRNIKYNENNTNLNKESARVIWEKIKKDFEL
ncbi:hypothetical protein EHQ68_10835 [Leptospira congkakensis]|uniref:DUF4381 domain-containing protein n=1 Tax=Leptospira congkakensis TaxID=2484932 RepID=A0A4Z1AEA8_9LEPT|nr:hypothetical protein [Leptospira congkakensis]TGL88309.1 hypothetical protein EHQ68_10835 [Leptospira congkakensis]TGL95415.1 hypothetical protein EHQ69_03020 [Leptospira congkakensis]TGL96496.1 hypothetical protein EHQ70_10070 [Leptospira congkakensis]